MTTHRAALALLAILPATAQNPASSPEFFESKIRPVLVNNCFGCHANSALGGLRLDSIEGMKKGGKRGPAVVPGDADKSLLLTSIKHSNPELKMPAGGAKLKPAEIADLEAWVKAGANWPKAAATTTTTAKDGQFVIRPDQRAFWSLQPLKKTTMPAVKNAAWAKTDIDRFILARLEKEGIAPVKAASRRDLIRRATLDLIGLPPTAEEIAAFENDKSPDAFARVVDRLLASPHYGERWGRVWLDVARFGEDDYRSLDPMRRGYNPYPNAHVYRDWVVQAFNDDLPYDQFVKAQIAGDLMDPKVRHRMLPATGFLGLGPWYYDNGAVEVTRADERHDRVDVITRGFLGLTVACARCHDHKYDPIPTTDYYALAGVFANTQYHEYPMAPKKTVAEFTHIEDELDRKRQILGETQEHLSEQLSHALAFQTSNYLEGVWEVTGKQKKEMSRVVEARKLDFELLDRWIKYMGKPTDKYKYKDDWLAMMKKGGTAEEAKKLATKFQDDVVSVMLAQDEIQEENKVIADKAMEGTRKKKRTNRPSDFVTNDDFCPGCGLQLKSLTEQENSFWLEIFLRELKDADDPAAMAAEGMRGTPGVLLFRGWGLQSRVGAEAQAQLKSLENDIDAAKKKLEPHYPYLHGVRDLGNVVNLPVSIRGNPFNLGQEIPRHFLTVLSDGEPKPFTRANSGRLELAEAIVKQPIAMRVIVNRVWKGHFGTGIVDSPSNFGFGGERPVHPELLEYLAGNFQADGMSIKKLHRKIMLSAVYQLSTENEPAAFEKDSGNRLYWRANRKRMDAEQVRDSILRVAGNLDTGLGGPSEDLTPKFTRRTIYGKVSRFKLDAYLQLFDFPSPAISAEKRFTTTVPLQRLFLMNSDFVQLEAEALARRAAEEPDNRSRIRKIYQLAFGRSPSEKEIALGLEYLRSEPLREYEEQKKKAAAEKDKPKAEGKDEEPATPEVSTATADSDGAPGAAGADQMMGMGMMAGMPGMDKRPGAGGKAPEIKYEASAWGRYTKVLLSSSEFTFIN